jgi:hypothetical protein
MVIAQGLTAPERERGEERLHTPPGNRNRYPGVVEDCERSQKADLHVPDDTP